jgi:predicted signal transduction protein with EAL and GGDEF domain
LDERFLVAGRSLHLGASIGLVRYPDHGDTPSDLLQRADAAMYAAKSREGGVLSFDDAGVCAPGDLAELLPERD